MLLDDKQIQSQQFTSPTKEQIYGDTIDPYADENLWETTTRYSDAFWSSSYENIISSKAAVSLYQAGEAIGENIAYLVSGEKKDPNFNPLNHIDGYGDYAADFIDCDTMDSVDRVKRRIDFENRNLDNMSKVPAGVNFINNMITGFLDPVNLIPVGGQALKAKGFVEGALKGGVVALGAAATQEYIIKKMSYNYTNDEYLQNVLLGTVFGAALSGSVAKLSSMAGDVKVKDIALSNDIKKNIDLTRKDLFDDKFQIEKSKAIDNYSKLNDKELLDIDIDSTIGAAQVKKESTELVDAGKIGNSIIAIERKWNGVLHNATSLSKKTREIANQLFEMPYFTKNIQDAQNMESINKSISERFAYHSKDLNNIYSRYYTDDKYNETFIGDVKVAYGQSKASEIGKMTSKDFFEAVTDNIRKGEISKNPYIVEASNLIKKETSLLGDKINELNKRGLVDVKAVDANYLPTQIDKVKVAEDRNGFTDALMEKLKERKADILKVNTNGKSNYDLTVDSINKETKFVDDTEKSLLSEVSPEIKKLNSREFFLKNDIKEKEGQIHELEMMIDKQIRSSSKTKDRIFSLDKDIDIPTDKDFAKQIKNGIPKDLEPKSLSEDFLDRNILIDDAEGYLKGEYKKYSLQGYTGKDIESKDIVSWDSIGETYWQDGWYNNRPFVDEIANDFIEDFNGVNKKYHQDSEKILRRQYDIDMMRDTLGRLGYNYQRMKPEEIDNLLTDIGNKGYLRKAYVDKARISELEKISKEKRIAIDDNFNRLSNLRNKLKDLNEELGLIKNDLQAKRRLRNMNKEDIKASKRKLKSLEKTKEWQVKLVSSTDDELRIYADELTNDVLGVKTDSGFTDGLDIEERGGLLGKDFLKGNLDVLDKYLVKDLRELLPSLRREAVDLSIIDKFGSLDLGVQKAEIVEDYARKVRKYEKFRENNPEYADSINKKIVNLDNERDKDLDFITIAIGRMRGTEYAKTKSSKGIMKVTSLIKLYNMMTSLGRVTVSSISDISGAVLHSSLKDSLPALKSFKEIFNPQMVKALSNNTDLSHALIEVASNARELNFSEMAQANAFNSKGMKMAKGYTDVFMHLTGLPRWNAWVKSFSGMAYMNKMYRVCKKFSETGVLSDSDKMFLNRFGFDENSAVEIFNNFNKHGNISGNQKYANAAMWEDVELGKAFRHSIAKFMDIAVVTPGAERAKIFDDPILSTIAQFKQFGLSAVGRTLIPALQNSRDYNTAVGILVAWCLGMASIAAKDAMSGKKNRTSGDLILEGFAQSGIAGWIEEPYKLINAATRGGFDRAMYAMTGGFLGQSSMSSYEANRDLMSVLGPSFGKLNNLIGFVGDVSTGNVNKSSMYKLKSLIPLQNTIYLDWALRGVIESYGE